MSTNDVPGARAANGDVLAMGCWAEPDDNSDDKSLIFVEGVENGRVVYSIFDLENDLEYRDAMREAEFKPYFSWEPERDGKSKKAKDDKVKWRWHDKTPFPWDRVIGKDIAKAGPRYSTAQKLLNAAQRVRDALNLRASKINRDALKAAHEDTVHDGATTGQVIASRIGRALDVLLGEDDRRSPE